MSAKSFPIKLFPLLSILFGFLYSTLLTFFPYQADHYLTIFFVVFCGTMILLATTLEESHFDQKTIFYSLATALCFQAAIHIGFAVSQAHSGILWIPDAINTHVPKAKHFMNVFSGTGPFPPIEQGQGFLTHFSTGIFFYLFGVTPLSSGISLILFRSMSTVLIYLLSNEIFKSYRISFIATIVYVFSPINLFHTTVLYKEAAVQFLVVAALWSGYLFFYQNKLQYSLLVVLSLLFLFYERYYIAHLMIICIGLQFIISKEGQRVYRLLSVLTLSILFFVASRYSVTGLIEGILVRIVNIRNNYSSYPDVQNEWNYNIPYWLAFIKIIFAPYFSFNKFKLFFEFSNLLIWGAILNQVLTCFQIAGIYTAMKKKFFDVAPMVVPIIIFLIVAAYTSPWSARIRDSFFPCFSIFIAYFLASLNLNHLKSFFGSLKKIKL